MANAREDAKPFFKLERPLRDEATIMKTPDEVVVNVGDPASDRLSARKFTVSMGGKMDSKGWNNYLRTEPSQEEALENMGQFARGRGRTVPIQDEPRVTRASPVTMTPVGIPDIRVTNPAPLTRVEPVKNAEEDMFTKFAQFLSAQQSQTLPHYAVLGGGGGPAASQGSLSGGHAPVKELSIPGLEFLKSDPQPARATIVFYSKTLGTQRANYHHVSVTHARSFVVLVFDTRDSYSNYWRPPGEAEEPTHFDCFPSMSNPDLKYRVAVMGISFMLGPLEVSLLPIVDEHYRDESDNIYDSEEE